MKPVRFLFIANVLLLACAFASLAAPTPTPEPTATPAATATATLPPTPTAAPTADMSNLVIVPGAYELMSGIPPERGLLGFDSVVAVENGTRLYVKVKLESGFFVVVFGGLGETWELLEMIPMELTPTPWAGREAWQREEMLGQ